MGADTTGNVQFPRPDYNTVPGETIYNQWFTAMQTADTQITNNTSFREGYSTVTNAINSVIGTGLIKNCVMSNGTSTMQTVNSTSYTDVNGSSISYTPPSGSTKVFYMFKAHVVALGSSGGYGDMKLFKNGSAVSGAHSDIALAKLTGTDAVIMYVFTAWSGAQTIKVQTRAYSSLYPLYINTTYSADGALTNLSVYNHYIVFSI